MSAEELAKQAADRVREVIGEAERAAEKVIREAEAEAKRIVGAAEREAHELRERTERARAALSDLVGGSRRADHHRCGDDGIARAARRGDARASGPVAGPEPAAAAAHAPSPPRRAPSLARRRHPAPGPRWPRMAAPTTRGRAWSR